MKKIIISVTLALLLMLYAAPVYAGIPTLPHAFYGSVTINGDTAPDGTQISATVDVGDVMPVQNPVSTVGGSFGTTSPKLLVQGDILDGAIITFHVTNANGTAIDGTAIFEVGGGPTPANLSVTIPVPPAGGGGGGFGPPGPPPGTTDVRGMISDVGIFTEPVTAISVDGLCTLDIPEGTVGLTADLEPLTEITIVIMDEPPPPPEAAHIIGLVYDFQPSGATFEPPIPLTFSYDPADIPEGVAEEDLVLAFYDEATGEWIELEGVVDPVTNTITALVAHFTAFGATFIPAPAAFSLSGLEVSPAEVEIGDTITISAVVENTGEKEGTCEVTFKVNDKVEETKNVALEPGASETVTFTTSRDVAGSYSVDVNGLTSSFTVKAPPELPPEEAPPEEAPPEVKPISWPLVGGIIAAVVVIAGLLIFFLVRRRRAY